MANEKHLAILKRDVGVWNKWRKRHPNITSDLRGADLSGADLREAHLSGADLRKADLREAKLSGTDLSGANLNEADLSEAYLRGADFSEAGLIMAHLIGADLRRANLNGAYLAGADLRGADLREANLIMAHLIDAHLREAHLSGAHLSGADLTGAILTEADLRKADLVGAHLSGADLREADFSEAGLIMADLSGANLTEADLTEADLRGAYLIHTNFQQATLSGCHIYGISAWDLELEGSTQENLVITQDDQPTITVDDLEVAQFIYLLLNNEKIRNVIDIVGKKAVLILGRFTPERKAILDAIRDALRQNGYLPILFDFEKPASRDFTSTVETLARLSRFIIADLSDPRCIPHELASVIPHLRTVPIQPILLASQSEYAMFGDYRAYPWVLATHHYTDLTDLLGVFKERVIEPAEKKAYELTGR